MKPVLHVVPSIAARYGGPSAAVVGMCRALATLGRPTVVATTDADGRGRLPVPTDELVSYEGLAVRFFPRQRSERLKFSRPLGAWLRAHVHEFAAVHVHAVFSYPSLSAGSACRRAGVPYVVRPLGTIDPWSLSRHAARKRVLMWWGGRALLTGAARIHYTAAEEQRRAEAALRWLPEAVVIPLGVDEDLFSVEKTAPPSGPRTVVSISRLDPKKGIDLLIEAFHRIAGRVPDVRLVVAGDGEADLVRQLEAQARAGRGGPRIEFTGWVDAAARRRLLARASIFVLPSHQENFGLAVAEAMATGTPVLVTGGVDLAPRIERDRAGWVVERSASAVAEALERSLADSGELASRGRRARLLADEFRWPVVARDLARLYDMLSERADAPAGERCHAATAAR
jgi:glycosyltransferase involved in cell wall biosynthesis